MHSIEIRAIASGSAMSRITPLMLLAITLLVPAGATARQAGTATPGPAPIADPGAVVAVLEQAEPPADLPGNDDAGITLVAWDDYFGQPLQNTVGAWVLTGSLESPIASILIFDSPESAEAGLGDYAVESSATAAGDLEAYIIADRGKWICVAADGPLLYIGQAEPAPGEEEDAVRERACEVITATRAWLGSLLAPASPVATPGD
jgi:hypothetical protein